MRVKSTTQAWLVGANKRIQIPENSILMLDPEEAIGTIQSPLHLEGSCIRITSELKQALADEGEHEERLKYAESLQKCLDVISDFEALPVVDSGSPLYQMRDLGSTGNWCSDKQLKTWLHHINMKIPHPSLSVEKAKFPNNEQHLVLVLTQTW